MNVYLIFLCVIIFILFLAIACGVTVYFLAKKSGKQEIETQNLEVTIDEAVQIKRDNAAHAGDSANDAREFMRKYTPKD